MEERSASQQQPRPSARDPFAFRVITGTIVVNLILAALVAFSLQVSRDHYDKLAEIWTQNTARILGNDLACILDKIGAVLDGAVHETRRQLASGGIQPAALDVFLQEQVQATPELFGLRIADAAGHLRHGTTLAPGEWVDISDRDYFRRLRDDPKGGLTSTELIRGRLTGQWNITLARRINHADGTFAGAAIGSFAVASFARLFSQLELGNRGAVGVRDQAFRLVALHPMGSEPGSQIGSDLVSDKTRTMVMTHPATATYRTVFARDHEERVVTFLRVDGYPFTIFATRAPSDYLVPWRREAAIALALLAGFAAATGVLAWTLLKSRNRERARSEAVRLGEQLRLQNEELNAALSRVKRLERVIPICAYCKKIRTEEQSWEQLEKYFCDHADATFSHGACPDCARELLGTVKNLG